MIYAVYNESHGGYKYVSKYDGNDSYAPIIHVQTLLFDNKESASKWLSDDDVIIEVEVPKEGE